MPGLPRYIARYLREKLELTSEQEEVALYSLEIFIYTGSAFLGVGLAGWLLGCLPATLIVALTIFVLRCFSGGAHSESPLGCIILSVLLIPLTAKGVVLSTPFFSLPFLLILIFFGFLLSLFLVWRLAPVDTPAKPVFSESHRRQLRILSLSTVGLVFFIQGGLSYFYPSPAAVMAILALAAGMLWQVFSLTGPGRRFFAVLDKLKTKKEVKENEKVLLRNVDGLVQHPGSGGGHNY